MTRDLYNFTQPVVTDRAKVAALHALRGRNPDGRLTEAERATARVIAQGIIEAEIARLELELTQLDADAASATQFLETSQLSIRARNFLAEHF
mgnify:FL=1